MGVAFAGYDVSIPADATPMGPLTSLFSRHFDLPPPGETVKTLFFRYLENNGLARILYGCPTISNHILRRYGDKIGAKHMAVYLGDLTYQERYT
jgi:hypothetical protein